MDTALLNFLAERLEALHRKETSAARSFRFDLGTFRERDHCGTVGCAAGWAVTDPALRDRFGLHPDPEEGWIFSAVVRRIAAAADVPEDLYWYFEGIFLPGDCWSHWYRLDSEPTALDVATAIRRFAGGVDVAELIAFRDQNGPVA